jgi:mono/diheme cytochrome c family protein
MRVGVLAILVIGISGIGPGVSSAQTTAQPQESNRSGAEIFRAACVSCHGRDGKGAPQSTVGFDVELPDFSDCRFSTPEADADWTATIRHGGPARSFSRLMPSFEEALSRDEISRVIEYIRGFCTERGWPRGDLNLPRPLATEKAFPENEAVVTTTIARGDAKSIASEFVYEHRLFRRGQWEAALPFALQKTGVGEWRRGLGDLALAYKHVLFDSLPHGAIVSAGTEVVLPTGKESDGLGDGTKIFEPFGAWSQILAHDSFLHVHAGVELPFGKHETEVPKESYWRVALGKTITSGIWERAWSPMIEVLGARELEEGQSAEWDVLPQMQVSLSRRQHLLVSAGVRIPVNKRDERRTSFVMYLLWDWFDGGLLSGW